MMRHSKIKSTKSELFKDKRERDIMAVKPHAVFIPYPAQSHIKAMLKLAKLLHYKGVKITFVNTDYNHRRFLRTGGPNYLDGLPDFQFESIPDGLPPVDADETQDVPSLCTAIEETCLGSFLDLVSKLSSPPTCIVSDGFMSFTIDAAEKLGVPVYLYWTLSACGFMGFYQYHILKERGIIPLKDEKDLTNGYLDNTVEIPGMKDIRLKDLPSFLKTTDANEIVLNYTMKAAQRTSLVTHVILHTFHELEPVLVNVLKSMFPIVYTIGPLQLLLNKVEEQETNLKFIKYSMWREETECLKWLESKEPKSVVYVNFGSVTVMSNEDLLEFGWGLANSEHSFLWVIRPDLVRGETAALPAEFLEVSKDRSFFASWCPQEEVLNHPSVGGFLTHCGWGSTIESLSAGIPMICWPFFADQPTLCRYICTEWEVGMEMGNNVKREEVERLVRELMDGEVGAKMKKKAMELKKLAEIATAPQGSSSFNMDKLVDSMFLTLK